MDILLLLLGIVFALVGAQLLVNGGVAFAGRFGIPTLVVGAVVVGFGTSTPELTVNIASALSGKTDLALGQGQNIRRWRRRQGECPLPERSSTSSSVWWRSSPAASSL